MTRRRFYKREKHSIERPRERKEQLVGNFKLIDWVSRFPLILFSFFLSFFTKCFYNGKLNSLGIVKALFYQTTDNQPWNLSFPLFTPPGTSFPNKLSNLFIKCYKYLFSPPLYTLFVTNEHARTLPPSLTSSPVLLLAGYHKKISLPLHLIGL